MAGPLRVLHVVVNMNRGGAETLIMNLYRNIDRSKVQFDFLTCKKGAFDSEIIQMGGKIHRIPYVTEVGHLGFVRELRRFLKANKAYKIIHAHMDKMSGSVLRLAKQEEIPIRIAHSHNTYSEGGLISRTYKWYVGSFINPSATHLYACSQKAASWLFQSRSAEAFILKNGIETKMFQFSMSNRNHVRRELQLEEDAMVLGHVGRFSHQKNHLFLIGVFANVSKKIPNAKLVLVGDGPLRSQLEERIAELQLGDKVKVLGVRDDIHRLVQAFDLFVFPSFHEGLPVTVIEAQSAGLPCIISDQITTEVDMEIGLVQYLPINDKNVWINRIVGLSQDNYPRIIAQDALLKKGYDISMTAERTELSYLTLGEEAI